MPSSRVDRRADVERHLAAAKKYIKIAESGDAERSAYEQAAIEIEAAMKEDPGLTQTEVGKRIGKGKDYVGRLLRALDRRRSGEQFQVDWQRSPESKVISGARKTASEHPKAFVEAFHKAPAAAQREIAREISKSPAVRIEAARYEAREQHKPTPVHKRKDLTMYQFESKLATAYGSLKQAFDLLDEVDQPGDNEDILFQINRLRTIVEIIEEAYRSGKSLDTWAAELWEEAQ